MNTNTLDIQIVDNPSQAPNYKKELPKIKGISCTKCIIVGNGTESGLPTVDMQFVDEQGNTYVTMLTGACFEMLGAAVAGKRIRDTQKPAGEKAH